ncbi:MAG: hypothetical protein WCI63_04305 [bacterium]
MLLIAGALWWWTSKEAEKKTQAEKAKAEAELGCGEITTEDGKYEGVGPYSPVVKAKIAGDYPKEQEICEWTVNGEYFGTSEPYGDYCIRYGLTFFHLGEYKVSYKVAGLNNCPKEKTLTITSLTPEETIRQKEAKQKLIDGGMTEAQIEAAENHMLRQY